MEKSKIDEILVSLGFGFPESKSENIAFVSGNVVIFAGIKKYIYHEV